MKRYSCNKSTNLSFSNLLNKTSLEYLNYKNISLISDKLRIYDTTNNFVDISTILCNYLMKNTETIDKGVNIMKKYNLTFDEIEKLIKISLQDYKDYYNSKKKKLIKNKFAK